MTSSVRFSLITSNCGTAFEDAKAMEPFCRQLGAKIDAIDADVVAIHMQEFGGQERDFSRKPDFERLLMSEKRRETYWCSPVLVVADGKDPHCTLLGNLYMIRRTLLPDVEVWNFSTSTFEQLIEAAPSDEGGSTTSNTAASDTDAPSTSTMKLGTHAINVRFSEAVNPKRKCKGFMVARLCVHGRAFAVVNVHMFADIDNGLALKEVPSAYSIDRQRAFQEMFAHAAFQGDGAPHELPVLLWGDCNFRLDLKPMVAWIRDEYGADFIKEIGDSCFKVADPARLWLNDATQRALLDKFDNELTRLNATLDEAQRLYELADVRFMPSFKRSTKKYEYAVKRACAWPDRVLATDGARQWLLSDNLRVHAYETLHGDGEIACDHFPVLLTFEVSMAPRVLLGTLKRTESTPARCEECGEGKTKARVMHRNAILWLCQSCMQQHRERFDKSGTLRGAGKKYDATVTVEEEALNKR